MPDRPFPWFPLVGRPGSVPRSFRAPGPLFPAMSAMSKPSKVFVVTTGDGVDLRIRAAYSSEDKARKVAKALGGTFEACDLDGDAFDNIKVYRPWRVTLDYSGEVSTMARGTELRRFDSQLGSEFQARGDGIADITVWAEDAECAIKQVREILLDTLGGRRGA